MKQLFKQSRKLHHFIYHTNRLYHLSSLSLCRNTLSLPNYSQQKHHNNPFNHNFFPFSTTPKDDTKSDSIESTTPTEASADTSDTTSESTIKPETTPTVSKTTQRRPIVHIHDEDRPQLSIQLPNRWPFKRLARKPAAPAEPLNMHEMTTFSGLPAQNFMPGETEILRDKQRKAQEQAKTKEQKKREARIKFWKRYSTLLLLTPMLLYIFDNRKAKKMATRRAEYMASATSSDTRPIRDMANLTNAELMDLYHWILKEECDDDIHAVMTLDEFGKIFVNAVNIVKQRRELTGGEKKATEIRLSREYDDDLSKRDKKRELKWLIKKFDGVKDNRLAAKNKELQPWDINIFFTEYKLPSSNKIPLTTLFIALSQITTDTLYYKAEVAFRIFTQQIQETEPEMTYNELIKLMDDMLITGHFTTDSLIRRRSYFPSTFGILKTEEICDTIYKVAAVDKGEDGSGCIKFEDFGDALITLSEGRRFWESCFGFFLPEWYKPWLQVWYCSERSKNEIVEAERKVQRKLKKEEEREKKKAAKLEKMKQKNIASDQDTESQKESGLKIQTN